jgi:cytochrome bd-type quinol oxidase subunit 2
MTEVDVLRALSWLAVAIAGLAGAYVLATLRTSNGHRPLVRALSLITLADLIGLLALAILRQAYTDHDSNFHGWQLVLLYIATVSFVVEPLVLCLAIWSVRRNGRGH